MKRLLFILLFLAAGSVSAQDIVTNLVVYARNLTSQNLANRYITLTPTDANTAGPWLVSAEPVKQKADTNGQTIFTNVVNGYYTLTLASTPPTTYSLAITNGPEDSVNVTNYLASSPGANGIGAAYTKSESNQRFLADAVAGTNIVLVTNTVSNRKLVTINSSASGGLSNLTDAASAQLSLADDTEIRGDTTVTFSDSNGDDALVIDTTAPRLHAMGDVNVSGNLYSTNAVTVSGLLSGAAATFSGGITNHSAAGFQGNASGLTNLGAANIAAGGTAPQLTLTTPAITGPATNTSYLAVNTGGSDPIPAGSYGIGRNVTTLDLSGPNNVRVKLDNDESTEASSSSFTVVSGDGTTLFTASEAQTVSFPALSGGNLDAGSVTASGFAGTLTTDDDTLAEIAAVIDTLPVEGHVILTTQGGEATTYRGANALSNAILDHVAGDVLTVFGTNILTAPIILTNATLRGGGNAVLVYDAANGDGAMVCPYYSSTVELITLYAFDRWSYGEVTNTLQLIGTDYTAGQPAITNAALKFVRTYGDQDAWYVRHTNFCSATLDFTYLYAGADSIAIQAPSDITYNNCIIAAPGTATYPRVAIVGDPGKATNIFNSCIVEIEAGGSATRGLTIGAAGTPTNTVTIFNGGIARNRGSSSAIVLIGPTSGSTPAHRLVVNGTRFENYGAADATAGAVQSTSQTNSFFINADLFSDTTATRQLLSSTKGLLRVWGGNADASQFTSAYTGGASNLFLRAATTAPSDTATPDAWCDMYIGTTLYKVPLYTP